MARLKKSLRPELISGAYAGIPWSVLDSQSFIGASDKAKSLLFALMRQHDGQNNGHLHLSKKWLSSKGWTCDSSNRKATKELVERGLIVQTRWGGLNAGPNMYALTWHKISNFVGLDIGAKGYQYAAYSLCVLPPTARRKPPSRKKIERPSNCDWAGSAVEKVASNAVSSVEAIESVLLTNAGSSIENNVLIPLPQFKKRNRIVGVKGKSGILKSDNDKLINHQDQAYH